MSSSQPETWEVMKLDGNAEQILIWIIECGQPSGDSNVTWELDDYGPIYFRTPTGTVTANQGDYVVRVTADEFRPCRMVLP